jgi:hypothetical protein
MELELKSSGSRLSKSGVDEYSKKIDDYDKKIAKYEKEKVDIQSEAKRFESVRNDAQRHSQIFGIAVIYLQIAILLSSIAALIKKKILWLLGVTVGLAGVIYFANGFFLFM